MSAPLLEVRNLRKYFPVRAGVFLRKIGDVHAVDDVSFTVERGRTLGLVGESGCGKTTVGRTILNLLPKSAGHVLFEGRDLSELKAAEWRPMRRQMQIVFQDPMESLNARHTVGRILEEPFIIHELGDAAFRLLAPPGFGVADERGEVAHFRARALCLDPGQQRDNLGGIGQCGPAHRSGACRPLRESRAPRAAWRGSEGGRDGVHRDAC